jgi:hypothetical protein
LKYDHVPWKLATVKAWWLSVSSPQIHYPLLSSKTHSELLSSDSWFCPPNE